jgi:hypothetical protein
VAEGVGPEFKPQYWNKKKRRRRKKEGRKETAVGQGEKTTSWTI